MTCLLVYMHDQFQNAFAVKGMFSCFYLKCFDTRPFFYCVFVFTCNKWNTDLFSPFFSMWQQIHALIMSLNFTGIEIKTAHSLESWNAGVLVMVSGSVQLKDFSRRRKFVQTFFLAPQEKGYFVLNDIFHFVEEEIIHHHPAVLLAQTNLDSKLNASATIPDPGIFMS